MDREKVIVKKFLEAGFYLLLAVAIAWFVLTFVGQRTTVDGDSMYNTLHDKDELIVEKLSYRFGDPERYDVIVFNYYKSKDEEPAHYIKRIIGLPGETVSIENGRICINGEELDDTYGYLLDGVPMDGYSLNDNPMTLGEDEYFVLGDNRNNSIDSRRIGAVNRQDILGRAIFRMYPFDRIGTID